MSGAVGILLVLALVQQPPGLEIPAEFLKLEDLWNQAHIQGDAETLDRLLADDIVVIVPRMPPFTKAEALAVFRSGRMKFQAYSTSDIKVRPYGDCVFVTGTLRRSRGMGDRVVEDHWRFTKAYARRSTGWRVVTFHASEAGG